MSLMTRIILDTNRNNPHKHYDVLTEHMYAHACMYNINIAAAAILLGYYFIVMV